MSMLNSYMDVKSGDLPGMPDPSRDPDGGSDLPTMPDPVRDPDRGQNLPTDPDPATGPPPRVDDPPLDDGDGDTGGVHKRIA